MIRLDRDVELHWHGETNVGAYAFPRDDRCRVRACVMLHVPFDEGSDVEAHGAHHLNVCVYAEVYGLDAYISDEVLPSIEILRADGFAPVAFAFPGGMMGNAIVDALEPHVPITRGITPLPQ